MDRVDTLPSLMTGMGRIHRVANQRTICKGRGRLHWDGKCGRLSCHYEGEE
jgi:hypothetical protein